MKEDYFALMERKQRAFHSAAALYDCRFQRDNGLVPQLKEARNYLKNWPAMKQNNIGLLLWGQPGNGKTFAAACIANALLEDPGPFPYSVRMLTFGTILAGLLAKSPLEKNQYLRELLECDLLILDDFGMERQTEYAQEQVFNIIDGRYLSGRPLIVTTNLSLSELKNARTMAQKRVYDRVLEMCVPVCFDGESLRQGRARENLKRYRDIVTKSETDSNCFSG